MKKSAFYTVYARYALLILATKLAHGGWLPPEIAHQIAADPAVIEMATGLLVGAAALAWYWASEAHKALRAVLDR